MGIWQSLWKFHEEIMREITVLGGFFFCGLIVLAFFALGFTSEALQLLVGFAIITALVVIIRMVYFRERPKRVDHTNFIERIDASSFPSLHTARIVFVALFVGIAWPLVLWKVFLVFIALLVAYSRIYLRKHDWIDVVVGGGLGMVVFYVLKLIFFSRFG